LEEKEPRVGASEAALRVEMDEMKSLIGTASSVSKIFDDRVKV